MAVVSRNLLLAIMPFWGAYWAASCVYWATFDDNRATSVLNRATFKDNWATSGIYCAKL